MLLPVWAACASSVVIEQTTVDAFVGGAGSLPLWLSALSLAEDDILHVVRVRSWRAIIHGPGSPGFVPVHWRQGWVPGGLSAGYRTL